MATVRSVNQNRHLYVAEKVIKEVKDLASTGDIAVGVVNNSSNPNGKEIYIASKGPDTVVKSPLIPVKNVSYVKAQSAEKLRKPLKVQVVELDSKVNEGNPIAGQDYVLRIVLRQFYGMGEEDVYFKEGLVHATKGMTAEEFYNEMVKSLNRSFSREVGANLKSNPYLEFDVLSETNSKVVYNPEATGKDNRTLTKTAGIVIKEKIQPWTLGIEQQEQVLYDAVATTVYVKDDEADEIWGKTYTATPNTADGSGLYIGNGHDIADLEYFCMGERGDQYRMIGWPNYVPTTYRVDPEKEYNTLDIHFAFTDDGANSYRSEKEVSVVCADKTVMNELIEAINTASGLSIDKLATTTTTSEASGAKEASTSDESSSTEEEKNTGEGVA